MAAAHKHLNWLVSPPGIDDMGYPITEPVAEVAPAAAPQQEGDPAVSSTFPIVSADAVASATGARELTRRDGMARGSLPASRVRHVFEGSAAAKVLAYFENMPEASQTRPVAPPRCSKQPSKFNTPELQRMLRFALCAGASSSGMSLKDQEEFAATALDIEAAASAGRKGAVAAAFPTPYAFVTAIRDEQNRCLSKRMWEQTPITINGTTYMFYSRDLLLVAIEMLRAAVHIRLTGEALAPGPDGTRMRSGTMDADDFLREEANVRRMHGIRAFVLGVQLYLDEALLSWSGAHYIFPVRMRVVNILDDGGRWVTVGYMSHVPMPVGQTEADKLAASDARNSLLQRSLVVLTRRFAAASRDGVDVALDGQKTLLAVPRVLGLIVDQPQERSLFCLMGNRCELPCSLCDVHRDVAGMAAAAGAKKRNVTALVEAQLAASIVRDRDPRVSLRGPVRREHSALAFAPALAAIHGLGTGDLKLYDIVSMDLLHVWKLGILRNLGSRFPDFMVSVCAGYQGGKARAAATPDILNKRGWELGRRCVPAPSPPGYVFTCLVASVLLLPRQLRFFVGILVQVWDALEYVDPAPNLTCSFHALF